MSHGQVETILQFGQKQQFGLTAITHKEATDLKTKRSLCNFLLFDELSKFSSIHIIFCVGLGFNLKLGLF